jgi:hypothetical protein
MGCRGSMLHHRYGDSNIKVGFHQISIIIDATVILELGNYGVARRGSIQKPNAGIQVAAPGGRGGHLLLTQRPCGEDDEIQPGRENFYSQLYCFKFLLPADLILQLSVIS